MLGRRYTFSAHLAAQFGLIHIPASLVRFPSHAAAYKHLDAIGAGECSFIVNGHPYPDTYYSLTRKQDAIQQEVFHG